MLFEWPFYPQTHSNKLARLMSIVLILLVAASERYRRPTVPGRLNLINGPRANIMLLRNTIARLITINGKFENGTRSEAYQVKPGDNPSVEVPNILCDNSFVKALIADGSLVVECDDDANAPVVDEAEQSAFEQMSKADLIELCNAQDIEVGSRDTVKTLAAKLEAHVE